MGKPRGQAAVRHAIAPSRHHLRWFSFDWDVTGGTRGVNVGMWRKLAKAIARDMIEGSNRTAYQKGL